MTKRVLALLLAACMLLPVLTACGGDKQPENNTPQVSGQNQPQTPENDGFSTSVGGRVEDTEGLVTEEQKQLMTRLLTDWYTDLALFDEPQLGGLFADEKDTAMHEASIRTLTAIRQQALTDLRMRDVNYVLTVTKAEPSIEEDAAEGQVHIEADETTVMHFAATPDVDSKMYDVPHIFELVPTEDGGWLIKHHEADDNPYFSLTYEEGAAVDGRLQQLLRAIERRSLQRQETVQVTLTCDHSYDRAAAEQYMRQYDHQRNDRWYAYDDVGGNCMNFGSQVLLAGGIPMDTDGGYETGWYWFSQHSTTLPWVNVGWFLDYAAVEREHGLAAVVNAPYFSGETGDIITMGVDEPANHTTVILDVIRDENGLPIDYLLCSNTADLRNFPASAYYYTNRQLTKIIGWNE